MKYCDMHIHSNRSDGTFSPTEIVERARTYRLAGISITDHDTVAGYDEAARAAKASHLEFVAGTELSTSGLNGRMHILGYFVDVRDAGLLAHNEKMAVSREERIRAICEKFVEIGIDCDLESVLTISAGALLGRPHLAEHLVNIGAVSTAKEAFDRYLTEGRPAYLPKWAPSPAETVELIDAAGGIAVAAHPGVTTGMMELIPELVEAGIEGIEAYYPGHSQDNQREALDYAKRFDLAVTGGSDCHGLRRGRPLLGIFKVRYEFMEKLKARWLAR